MVISNLDKYRKDLDNLLDEASWVKYSLQCAATSRAEFHAQITQTLKGDEKKAEIFMGNIKPFASAYQQWYSESLSLVKQLLPDRLSDFIRLYEKPKTRKEITFENYRIEDACQGLRVSFAGVVKADASSAKPLLDQQVAIVEAIKRRFESSLFDIKQLVQADLYDSELDTARGLLKSGFTRAAGAIAGVVLEGHLKQLRDKYELPNKLSTIGPINDALKAANIIELSQLRHIQLLGNLRNKCSHRNENEPTTEEVNELISGVDKVIKTVF
ncbi:hypothetical protein [Pseudomonas sp. IT-194MI4]|uniref:hypothetical protein n=1 Tax=Pseudomonas sp. IT-194MI4 TaxID=3026443 RepID=UPI0039E0E858